MNSSLASILDGFQTELGQFMDDMIVIIMTIIKS